MFRNNNQPYYTNRLGFSSSISSCSGCKVPILFEVTPGMAPTEFMNLLKTKTARFARRDYPTEVGRFYWKPYFWSSSYFVATVSEQSLSLVQEYIKNQ
ncbi:REP element-mobilizing transposase RayT [Lachnospiraceae bacterium PF1-21]|uniref:IS200/IS605 family transposase n=1 Tax=Ohessyouella blattaphilus TaxID=2949333 RepID=A0ABT1EHD5_9FIRM|nr:IS200/IS605 family transposase [Ohessyouella blattaphilus]MCP1110110.1 IS200/IS605 family transposase [Ohessyouella blattaphilus]MCR8563504.1 IS200/IS605 family transposase [Ohessyouella blattaphilus]